MGLKRIDNVALVVDDIKSAAAFFVELGMVELGGATVSGKWVDEVVGLKDTTSDILMLQTPDGHSRLELTRFQNPPAVGPSPRDLAANGRGWNRVMFTVDDIDDTVARLEKLGGTVVDKVVQYENAYRLCYMRGPEGILIALAQELAGASR